MNRRDLFKSLALLPALQPLIRLNESPTRPPDVGYVDDPDWIIKWYGWRQMPAQHVIIGYWLARNERKKLMAYSSCPGDIGWIYEGQLMNTGAQQDQIFVTPDTPVSVAENEQEKALKKLILFLKTEKPPDYTSRQGSIARNRS